MTILKRELGILGLLCVLFQSIEGLIKEGADVNARSRDGMTPLGIAAFWGYADIAEILLQNG